MVIPIRRTKAAATPISFKTRQNCIRKRGKAIRDPPL
jgi:hypothetical protein